MASLEELLELPGVLLAFEFSQDGQLLAHRAKVNVPQDVTALAAQFSGAVSGMLNALATAYSRSSSMNWIPPEGWAYSGGGWTVAVGRCGDRWHGVFSETAKIDYNNLYAALVEERDASRVLPWPWTE
jgi:roadblock/LC7 domain-containing protein